MQQNPTNQSSNGVAGQGRPEGIASIINPAVGDSPSALTEMAQRDLDAALQLLADRAQYITGASGAAIALKRDGRNDMLCRASAGSNAPELGALLSAEFGLSGESVRTRRLLRCDDAERDARVNREVCRQLGIASVVVMPVVNDDEVLGVFELFSGRTHAFGERDLSAVQRLSEMVEAAVRLARATEALPAMLKAKAAPPAVVATPEEILDEDILEVDVVGPANATTAPLETTNADAKLAKAMETAGEKPLSASSEPCLSTEAVAEKAAIPEKSPATSQPQAESAPLASRKDLSPLPKQSGAAEPAAPVKISHIPVTQAPVPATRVSSSVAPAPTPPKSLLWSAAAVAGENAKPAQAEDQSNVPPVLRGLRKCEACGFPISGGRLLCVECEEKKWRGQLRKPAGTPMPTGAIPSVTESKPSVQAVAAAGSLSKMTTQTAGAVATKTAEVPAKVATESIKAPASVAPMTKASESAERAQTVSEAPLFSAGLAPSQSWLARNKYVLVVLIVVAAAIAGILLLR